MNETYTVEVKSIAGTITHSVHNSYRDAVDQADMVRGIVAGDEAAWKYATSSQGYTGTFAEWQSQDDDERAEYEQAAAGIPTA